MKKKGFTLVELLAVIVILAIIAVIATPIILGVIEKSKKGAAESSALGYVDAVEKQIARNLLDEDATNDITDGVYEIADLTSKEVKVKGDKPIEESWVEIEKKQVVSYSIKIGDYVITYNKKTKKIETTKNGDIAQKPIIYHYAYGTPTTSSTTDYTTLGHKIFVRLGSDGTKEVCIDDEGLFCIKPNEYETSKERLKAHFGESNCDDYGSVFNCSDESIVADCNSSGFNSSAGSYGYVNFGYVSACWTREACDINAEGYFSCMQ